MMKSIFTHRSFVKFLTAGAFIAMAAGAVCAQRPSPVDTRSIGLDQKLNAQIPLDTHFTDETGKQVLLGKYFGKRPVVLALVWYKCPGICGVELESMVDIFKSQKFRLGKDYEAVTISINPQETPELAAAKKAEYVKLLGNSPDAEKGWHFLTGDDADIHRVAAAIGYRYVYDKSTGQYAHPAGILLITPQGKVSKYFYGVEYRPRDMRLGLVDASSGKIGTAVDEFLLECYHYDPNTGRYTLAITNILRAAGVLTLVVIALFWVAMFRYERKRAAQQKAILNKTPSHL
jgi:protein SCO1/2